jgi:hypothetical protein
MNRRSLLFGSIALIAAPAIVRAESLMKIVPRPFDPYRDPRLKFVRMLEPNELDRLIRLKEKILTDLATPALMLGKRDGGQVFTYPIPSQNQIAALYGINRRLEELRA